MKIEHVGSLFLGVGYALVVGGIAVWHGGPAAMVAAGVGSAIAGVVVLWAEVEDG